MTLTRFFYIDSDQTKVFKYNYHCNYPKKTKRWSHLKKLLIDNPNIIGIGYEYNSVHCTPIVYIKLK